MPKSLLADSPKTFLDAKNIPFDHSLLKSKTNAVLKKLCEDLKLKVGGNHSELLNRIIQHQSNETTKSEAGKRKREEGDNTHLMYHIIAHNGNEKKPQIVSNANSEGETSKDEPNESDLSCDEHGIMEERKPKQRRKSGTAGCYLFQVITVGKWNNDTSLSMIPIAEIPAEVRRLVEKESKYYFQISKFEKTYGSINYFEISKYRGTNGSNSLDDQEIMKKFFFNEDETFKNYGSPDGEIPKGTPIKFIVTLKVHVSN